MAHSGAIYRLRTMRFLARVRIGDGATATVEIVQTVPTPRRAVLTGCRNGQAVLERPGAVENRRPDGA